MLPLKFEYNKLINKSNGLLLEVQDSKLFIEDLKKRLDSLNESIKTRQFIKELPIEYCPHCLSKLQETKEPNICTLCKTDLTLENELTPALKMKLEIDFQIKESSELLKQREKELTSINNQIPIIRSTLINLQRNYNETIKTIKSSRDEEYEYLLTRKGEINNEISNLLQQLNSANVIQELDGQITSLKKEIEKTKKVISTRFLLQNKNLALATKEIAQNTLYLLRNDLKVEELFDNGLDIILDFQRNTFAIDGRNNFSASSIIYLKNSVHFGIFFASLALEFFRYPRFILCDNIEDKGMQEKRSQNFQRLIVALSEQSNTEHQIIFTTSMIDPSLNNSKYCVGEFYTKDKKKSLNV
jgi:hypothetical protein